MTNFFGDVWLGGGPSKSALIQFDPLGKQPVSTLTSETLVNGAPPEVPLAGQHPRRRGHSVSPASLHSPPLEKQARPSSVSAVCLCREPRVLDWGELPRSRW